MIPDSNSFIQKSLKDYKLVASRVFNIAESEVTEEQEDFVKETLIRYAYGDSELSVSSISEKVPDTKMQLLMDSLIKYISTASRRPGEVKVLLGNSERDQDNSFTSKSWEHISVLEGLELGAVLNKLFSIDASKWSDKDSALKKFKESVDLNRTSIRPVEISSSGMMWWMYYDDQLISKSATLEGVLWKYCIYSVIFNNPVEDSSNLEPTPNLVDISILKVGDEIHYYYIHSETGKEVGVVKEENFHSEGIIVHGDAWKHYVQKPYIFKVIRNGETIFEGGV
jgi:hypothetical protein